MASYVSLNKKRYIPDLAELQACCTRNYVSLDRLLLGLGNETSLVFGHDGEQKVTLTVVELARYTTTIEISQNKALGPSYIKPSMEVRMYHDARMAEVLSSQQISGVRARYDYPNSRMHQRDEKIQINRFLAEWLSFCFEHGIKPTNVFNNSLS
ncbi:DUF1249 domain-containing protein [Echinimonas agarilytica]|uniref:DUF1249 domain-containing protein n=1 Tax=Echinimonas agarilytica TaxID=1215918 RepID=A0AA42B7Z8_9GAMM|nr:DUF1249 domain-containing protein [Echinimonas agarilytica]MCM2680392.1 DUF1249 domain-containing protein [Echinimonas agarilytica]